MANVTFKGTPVQTAGNLPAKGSTAPDFKLCAGDLSEATLANFAGKKKILNISHSYDTGTCQVSARKFNAAVASLPNVALINISADLPFAQKRFCDAEKLTHVTNLSTFRSHDFGKAYGCLAVSGILVGLNARAVVVLDENNKVLHTEQVGETTGEPNYDAAIAAVK